MFDIYVYLSYWCRIQYYLLYSYKFLIIPESLIDFFVIFNLALLFNLIKIEKWCLLRFWHVFRKWGRTQFKEGHTCGSKTYIMAVLNMFWKASWTNLNLLNAVLPEAQLPGGVSVERDDVPLGRANHSGSVAHANLGKIGIKSRAKYI